MHLSIDTTQELTDLDRRILEVLTGGEAPTPAPKATAAKKTAAAKPTPAPEPEPEPEPEDDDLIGGGEPTLQDAKDRAQELVDAKKGAKVKAALATQGAKRVSDLDGAQIQGFLDELDDA